MNPRFALSLVVAAGLAVAILSTKPPPAEAGNLNVVPKVFDLTQGYQIPAAGDTLATGPTSTPANGDITLAATAGLRTACVYSRVIDITAPIQSRPETFSGPAYGPGGFNFFASQASGTVGVSVTALYGVAASTVTTPVDMSSTSATDTFSIYADSFGSVPAQADKTKVRWYTNHVPRNARYMRFLLQNKGGVALTIPAGQWSYISP